MNVLSAPLEINFDANSESIWSTVSEKLSELRTLQSDNVLIISSGNKKLLHEIWPHLRFTFFAVFNFLYFRSLICAEIT